MIASLQDKDIFIIRRAAIMQQLTFEAMFREFVQDKIHLKKRVKKELIVHMTSAIIEIIKKERSKTDDNLSSQP
jgi:hypothetical protein